MALVFLVLFLPRPASAEDREVVVGAAVGL